jgi:hypothetical protein
MMPLASTWALKESDLTYSVDELSTRTSRKNGKVFVAVIAMNVSLEVRPRT